MPAERRRSHIDEKLNRVEDIATLNLIFFLIKQLRNRRVNLTKNSKVSTILIIIVNLWISGHCRKWL